MLCSVVKHTEAVESAKEVHGALPLSKCTTKVHYSVDNLLISPRIGLSFKPNFIFQREKVASQCLCFLI